MLHPNSHGFKPGQSTIAYDFDPRMFLTRKSQFHFDCKNTKNT